MTPRKSLLKAQYALNAARNAMYEAELALDRAVTEARKWGVANPEIVAITDYAMGYEACPYCSKRDSEHAATCPLHEDERNER